MLVEIDDGKQVEVLNHVKVIFGGDGRERHVTITHEGIIVDLIFAGEVEKTASRPWDDWEWMDGDL